jgi:HSP20 family protein
VSRGRPALAGLLDLRERMNQLFDELVQPREATSGQFAWSPVADVFETTTGFALQLELPGVDPAAVEVDVADSFVTVRGRRGFPAPPPEGVHRVERHYGHFVRTFELPAKVAPTARRGYDRGVLTLEFDRAGG